MLALSACTVFHHLYPSLPGASALRAAAALAAGNGVAALALSAKTSPLPFRCGTVVDGRVPAWLLVQAGAAGRAKYLRLF